MHRRSVMAALAALGLLAGGAAVAGAGGSADPQVIGRFQAPFAEDPRFASRPPANVAESLETPPAVSMVVLPDGRILYWGGLEGLEDCAAPIALDAGRCAKLSRSRLLDLRGGAPVWAVPSPETGPSDDMFCADQRILPDGRVMVVGGTIYRNDPVDLTPVTGPGGPGGTAELFGSNATRFFHPATNTWTSGQPMGFGRWYPSLITLPDGKMLVVSGVGRLIYNFSGLNVHQTETWDPATGQWTDNGPDAQIALPLFARIHLMPDGKVLYDGNGQRWGPFGQQADQALENLQQAYDPATKTWTVTGVGLVGARSGAIDALLPLRPPYDRAQILMAGGTLGTSPGSYVANNLTEIVTYQDGRTTSVPGPNLNHPRWYSSTVLLPDGSVLAVSGADRDEVVAPGTESEVRQAELLVPGPGGDYANGRWIAAAVGSRDRTYHNTAVLLPDGRVLVGGHSPINSLYGPKGNGTGDNTVYGPGGLAEGLTANNLKDPSLEIYEPPYLFRGPRPQITAAPSGLAWGSTFGISYSGTVEKVVLIRLPATTHVTDADMRAVELAFERHQPGLLVASAPPNGAVAPPGFYYLFVVSPGGVPSKAAVVKVGASADPSPAPFPFGNS